jgi:hypothetical protein
MRDLLFAASCGGALFLAASPGNAQSVPARDLLDYPVGALADAPALASGPVGGIYNPATLAPGRRDASTRSLRLTLGKLGSPGERGLNGELVHLAAIPFPRLGVALTAVHASIIPIPRTGADPFAVLGDAQYGSWMASASGAWRVQRHVSLGVAARYRYGQMDSTTAGALGGDAGVVVDGLLGRYDVRLATASYLWRPNATRDDRPGMFAGADARVVGTSATREGRLGYSYSASRGGPRESYVFGTGRYRYFEATAGLVRATAYGHSAILNRIGAGLHYARLFAGVASEMGTFAGNIYQITFSTGF